MNHNSILYFSWLYVWQLVVGYQIVTHIPPPELWLAINFKRTFFLVQVNHCSSLTTQEEICSWGKEKKNIWEIFFETQECLSSNVWTLLYVWMWCLEPLQSPCCRIQLSRYLFTKINMSRMAEEDSGLLEDIPETLTGPTAGTAPPLNFLVNNCYPSLFKPFWNIYSGNYDQKCFYKHPVFGWLQTLVHLLIHVWLWQICLESWSHARHCAEGWRQRRLGSVF